MEIASIVASFVSLIVGILAGSLAIFFYIKQKEDANRAENALTAIREQTNALQSISSGFLDRLTKYVTTPPKVQHTDPSRLVIDTLKGIPEVIQLLRITEVSNPASPGSPDVRLLVALQCYTAEANYWAGGALPPVESL